MRKDGKETVSINRESFPDKTILYLMSSNWNCNEPVSQLTCENGEWKNKPITECPVTLGKIF
jgi:hypothetical protein